MSKRKVIAIIPARGGSKGVYKKNIKLVKGKPLIAYTIEVAKKSKLINEIFVSTDDKKIAETANQYGVEVIPRPEDLAQDDTPDLPVFKHAILYLEKKGIKTELIVNLRPTAPLRTVEDIDSAIKTMFNTKADSVRSFCEVNEHPYWMFKIVNGRSIPFIPEHSISKYPRRQLLPKLYILNGAVDIMRAKCVKKDLLYGKDMRAYIMPRTRSIDLDTEEDFKILEFFL